MAKITRPNKPLADVNVLPCDDGSHEIVVCFMPDPDTIILEKDARVVLAFDASRSIKQMYGGGVWDSKPNFVQNVGRKLGEILARATRSGKVSMMYWALGLHGPDTELIGDFDRQSAATADISGPSKGDWGTGTQALPSIRHIVENVAQDAEWTMGVLITDGIIEDEAACMDYCRKLGQELDSGKLKDKEIKLILIGVGTEIDKDQLERFDDMFEDTPLEDKVDIWSHGVAASIRDEDDIICVLFGELMTEEMIIADSGYIVDDRGNLLVSFADGLPGKIRFILPKGCQTFTIHSPIGEVTQDITGAVD